jgi:hypothetical protein
MVWRVLNLEMRMKKAVLVALTLMTTTSLYAERESLIEFSDKWNLFSKFELGYTEIDASGATQGGVTVGGLLNDKLGLGIAGYTILDTADTESPALENISNTDFWYAGGFAEYVFNPHQLVYWSIDMFIGGGELNVKRTFGGEENQNVFVMEPGLNLMVNVTETFMLGLGASYRLVQGVDIEELSNSDMSGISGTFFLRFTQF